MNIGLILITAIIALIIIWQLSAIIKSKKTVGKNIPYDKLDAELEDSIKDKSGLLYFFSPNCSNCKKQSPIIDDLMKKHNNIFSINVYKYISTAKAFNIAGTPSIVFFAGNKIQGHYVGLKQESFIFEKLRNIT